MPDLFQVVHQNTGSFLAVVVGDLECLEAALQGKAKYIHKLCRHQHATGSSLDLLDPSLLVLFAGRIGAVLPGEGMSWGSVLHGRAGGVLHGKIGVRRVGHHKQLAQEGNGPRRGAGDAAHPQHGGQKLRLAIHELLRTGEVAQEKSQPREYEACDVGDYRGLVPGQNRGPIFRPRTSQRGLRVLQQMPQRPQKGLEEGSVSFRGIRKGLAQHQLLQGNLPLLCRQRLPFQPYAHRLALGVVAPQYQQALQHSRDVWKPGPHLAAHAEGFPVPREDVQSDAEVPHPVMVQLRVRGEGGEPGEVSDYKGASQGPPPGA
eukprot:RCo023088